MFYFWYNKSMVIKIKVFNRFESHKMILDGDKNLVEYNGLVITKNVDNEIKKFINIFSSWNGDYNNPMCCDIEDFDVTVFDGKKSKSITGCGNFPENYDEFKKLLKEIIKCF